MVKTSLHKDKIRILLLEGIHASARQTFLHAGYNNVECLSTSLAEEQLIEKLKRVHLLGAAIDVFPVEPKSNDEAFVSPLTRFDNCILTPHVGGSTMEAQENIGLEVSAKLIKYSDNGSTISSVNFPEAALPEHPGSHRILHIHENQPGVLSEINKFFSDHSINISAQFLQTNEAVGYVVTDIDEEYSALALKELQSIQGTIRTRILF